MPLETRQNRRHLRSKCEVTLQEVLCRLKERRAPPAKATVPLHARKPMPRQLAPLHVACSSLSGKRLTSDSSIAKEDTLLLRSVPHANPVSKDHSQLLSFPLKARESSCSFLTGTGSNYDGLHQGGKFRSPLTLSARSKSSIVSLGCNQTSQLQHLPQSDIFRTPKVSVRKGVPLPYLQRTPSPTTSSLQTPYLMRTRQIHPQPRPPNPLASKTNQRKRKHQRNQQCAESSVGAQIQQVGGSDALQNRAEQTSPPGSPGHARACAVSVEVPEAVSNNANSIVESNQLLPDRACMVVPAITIRTATPNCPPGLVVPAITIRTATPLPGDPPTTEGTEISQGFVDKSMCAINYVTH